MNHYFELIVKADNKVISKAVVFDNINSNDVVEMEKRIKDYWSIDHNLDGLMITSKKHENETCDFAIDLKQIVAPIFIGCPNGYCEGMGYCVFSNDGNCPRC